METLGDPWPTTAPRRARRPAVGPRQSSEELVSRSTRTHVHISGWKTRDDPWPAAAPRRAQRPAAGPHQSSEELVSRTARTRVHASVRPLGDPWPTTAPQRVRRSAASPRQSSEELVGRSARTHVHDPESRVTIPGQPPRSEEHCSRLPPQLGAPKSSSPSERGLASTPPWRPSTTSHPGPSSEELRPKLSIRSGAPRSTDENQREIESRLHECQPAPSASAPRPEGHDPSPVEAGGPSWDPSANR